TKETRPLKVQGKPRNNQTPKEVFEKNHGALIVTQCVYVLSSKK
ncbi:13004_t:CDS:1, partial [Dentiscutata erythropus]